MARTPVLDIDAMLADRHTRIVVCCGSGGVGKTTTAAALALRAAEAGREVVVLTIDPARRLAQSLGLTELDNVPRPVSGLADDAVPGGRLDAMMLDMKRTFDEVVLAHSTREAAEQVRAAPGEHVPGAEELGSLRGRVEFKRCSRVGGQLVGLCRAAQRLSGEEQRKVGLVWNSKRDGGAFRARGRAG